MPIEMHAEIDGRLLLYSAVLLVLTTVFCALAPALQATRPSLVPALKQEEPRYAHRRWTLRGFLVIGQVAVALVLLLTALALCPESEPGRWRRSRIRYRPHAGRADELRRRTLHARDAGGFPPGGCRSVECAAERGARDVLARRAAHDPQRHDDGGGASFGGLEDLVSITVRGQPGRPRLFFVMGIRLLRGRDFRLTIDPDRRAWSSLTKSSRRRHLRRHRSGGPPDSVAGGGGADLSGRNRRHCQQQPSPHDWRDASRRPCTSRFCSAAIAAGSSTCWSAREPTPRRSCEMCGKCSPRWTLRGR